MFYHKPKHSHKYAHTNLNETFNDMFRHVSTATQLQHIATSTQETEGVPPDASAMGDVQVQYFYICLTCCLSESWFATDVFVFICF